MEQQKVDNLLPKDGEVYYFSGFYSKAESDLFLDKLFQEIPWKHEPIKIFGKEILQPRLTAWIGDTGLDYSYSGIKMRPYPWTPTLGKIKEKIEQEIGIVFNSALLNQYRNENDSVGWHSDNERELGVNPIIASISFGQAREFQLKHRSNKNLKESILLEHGSLLLMQGKTQHHWIHAIPKRRQLMQARINITFRQIKIF